MIPVSENNDEYHHENGFKKTNLVLKQILNNLPMDHKEPSKLDKLFTHGEEYLKTRQELSKLIALQKTSGIAAALFSSLIIFFLFFFVIVFASVALAYVISLYTGQTYIGFLSVAGLYLLAGLILYSKRKTLLEQPVANSIIHNFLNTDDHEQD